jgi:hypothetical protein
MGLTGSRHAQQPPKQDPATLELARSIYAQAFTALREAKTLEDMKKLADSLDSLDWISVDRFGRPVQTRQDSDRELTSMLNLDAARSEKRRCGTEHRLLEGILIRSPTRHTPPKIDE